MNKKFISLLGILGVILFVGVSIIGGLLIEDYSVISQFISETYAIDTEYGHSLRVFGVIPSGILLTSFYIGCLLLFRKLKRVKIGFLGLALFYGLATIMVGIFPCDSGCNKELIDPSNSQLIHNLMGFLTYFFVPLSIFLIGSGLRKIPIYKDPGMKAYMYGLFSLIFVFLLFSNQNSSYIGLFQRIIETLFIIWTITCILLIYNLDNDSLRPKSE